MTTSIGDVDRDADQTDLIARQLDRPPNDGIGVLDLQQLVKGGGGAMSYETACGRPLGATNGYLRAIAVYSGSAQITSGPCPPTKPVAYYASHGTNDTVLQYSGGVTMAQNFAKANGCTWATPTQATGNHVCTNLMGCMPGYPVEFCSFVGPHTPDPSDGGGGSWEYQNVWTFFSQF